MIRREIDYKGKKLPVVEIEFDIKSEQWNTYKTYDGVIVRMKTSPLKILRVLNDDGTPATTEAGDPHIIVSHDTSIVTSEGA